MTAKTKVTEVMNSVGRKNQTIFQFFSQKRFVIHFYPLSGRYSKSTWHIYLFCSLMPVSPLKFKCNQAVIKENNNKASPHINLLVTSHRPPEWRLRVIYVLPGVERNNLCQLFPENDTLFSGKSRLKFILELGPRVTWRRWWKLFS